MHSASRKHQRARKPSVEFRVLETNRTKERVENELLPQVESLMDACAVEELTRKAIEKRLRIIDAHAQENLLNSLLEGLRNSIAASRRLETLIVRREGVMMALMGDVALHEDGIIDDEELALRCQMSSQALQTVGVAIVDTVGKWRKNFTQPIPLMHEGRNYLLKMLEDAHALSATEKPALGTLDVCVERPLGGKPDAVFGGGSSRRGSHASARSVPMSDAVTVLSSDSKAADRKAAKSLLPNAGMFPYSVNSRNTTKVPTGPTDAEIRSAEKIIIAEYQVQVNMWQSQVMCCERGVHVPLLRCILDELGPLEIPEFKCEKELREAVACFRAFTHCYSVNRKRELGLKPFADKKINPSSLGLVQRLPYVNFRDRRFALADFCLMTVTAVFMKKIMGRWKKFGVERARRRQVAVALGLMSEAQIKRHRLVDWARFIILRRQQRKETAAEIVEEAMSSYPLLAYDVPPPSFSVAGTQTPMKIRSRTNRPAREQTVDGSVKERLQIVNRSGSSLYISIQPYR